MILAIECVYRSVLVNVSACLDIFKIHVRPLGPFLNVRLYRLVNCIRVFTAGSNQLENQHEECQPSRARSKGTKAAVAPLILRFRVVHEVVGLQQGFQIRQTIEKDPYGQPEKAQREETGAQAAAGSDPRV